MFHDSPQMGRASAGALKPWKVIRADLRFLWPTKNHLKRPTNFNPGSKQFHTIQWYTTIGRLFLCVKFGVLHLGGLGSEHWKAANPLICKAASRSQDEGLVACFIILASQDRWRLNILGILGGGNSNMFYFHPYLGKWSNLTSIFFKWVFSTTQPVYNSSPCHDLGVKEVPYQA